MIDRCVHCLLLLCGVDVVDRREGEEHQRETERQAQGFRTC